MSAVPILGAVVFAGAVVAWVTWHRTVDERHSVQHHQHALETLRHVADRAEPPFARRTTTRPAATRRALPGVAPQARAVVRSRPAPLTRRRPPASNTQSRPAGRAVTGANGAKKRAPSAAHPTMVFVVDDSAPASDRATPVKALRPEADVAGRAAGAPASHPGHRPRRSALAALVAAALVAAAVVGVALSSGSAPTRHPAPPPPDRARPSTRDNGTASRSTVPLSTRSTTATTTPSSGAASTTPSTTALAPTVAGAHSATYGAPAAAYTVGITASGQCWVMGQTAASGQVLWTGTLNAGDSRSLSASGTVVLRLGAASDVVVAVDGVPVQLPAGFQSPFTMTFQA